MRLASDDRFRGRSVSEGRPVARLDVSFDAPSGAYVGVSAAAVEAAHVGPRFLSAQGYVGYARRLASGASLDVGVSHTGYSEYYRGGGSARFTEAYVGVITDRLAAHLYASPNYFGSGAATLYAELDSSVRPAPRWRLSAHVGALAYVGGRRFEGVNDVQYDWRVGLSRTLGGFEGQVAWAGAGPDPDYYGGRERARQGLLVSLSRRF